MPHEVFISHASQDKAAAERICATLEADGLVCWMAPRDVTPGAEWAGAITEAIASSRALVLLLSSSANSSPQVLREIERAAERGIQIVPVRIEDVRPAPKLEFYIGALHWMDAVAPPLEVHARTLAVNLKFAIANESERELTGQRHDRDDPASPGWWSRRSVVFIEPFSPNQIDQTETTGYGLLHSFDDDTVWKAEYADGGLRLVNEHHPFAGRYISLAIDDADAPMSVDVRVERIGGGHDFAGAGLLYRRGPAQGHYAYLLCADESLAFLRSYPDRYTMLFTGRSMTYRSGTWNRLGIVGLGPAFFLFLNEQLVGRVQDSDAPLLKGPPGIMVKGPGRFTFDNLTLYKSSSS